MIGPVSPEVATMIIQHSFQFMGAQNAQIVIARSRNPDKIALDSL
jgi:hypothetical protein